MGSPRGGKRIDPMDTVPEPLKGQHHVLAEFWTCVATHPHAFLHGPVERGISSAEDIARQMSSDFDCVEGASFGDSQAVFLTLDGFVSVFPANEIRNSEGGFAEYQIKAHCDPSVNPRQGLLLLYAVALCWIYANGGVWASDTSPNLDGLLATGLMLSSALREQSTAHLKPVPHQKLSYWRDGDFENNVAALAERESEVTHERLPELADYAFDADRGRVVAANGREIKPDEIREILARGNPDRIAGIGEAALTRALATRAALQGSGDIFGDRGMALRQAAKLFAETTPL
jgi:hypothetical protein